MIKNINKNVGNVIDFPDSLDFSILPTRFIIEPFRWKNNYENII